MVCFIISDTPVETTISPEAGLTFEETRMTPEQVIKEACEEFFDSCNQKLQDALLHATKSSLDSLKKRISLRYITFSSFFLF